MATFLKSNASPASSGDNPIYLENDPIIIRGQTLGLMDFSNAVTWSGGSPIPKYANLLNLVYGGTNGTNGPNDRVLETGMLKFNGTEPNVNDYVLLPPNEFTLPAGCKRALISVALVLPASGYGTPVASRYPMFMGRLNNTQAANVNFGIWGIISTAGVLTSVQGAGLGASPLSAASALPTLTDGNKHVVTVYLDGETTPGRLASYIYVDNTLVNQATLTTWDGVVPQPSNAPRIGSYSATIHSPWGGMKIGRPLLMNLTGKTTSAVDIIARQVELTNQYLV